MGERQRRRWSVLVLVLSSAVAALACGRKIQPGLKVEVDVAGNARPGQRATRVVARFDRDVVPKAVVGRDLTAEAALQAPLTIMPRVPATWRWLDQRTLALLPAAPLPRSTAYEVRIPRGTVALDGKGLVDDHRHLFQTERLGLLVSLERKAGIDPGRWAGQDQPVEITFTQPVNAADVARHCGYHGPKRIAAQPLPLPAGTAETRREVVRVGPAQPLDRGSEWHFRCEPSMSAAEGPLGLSDAGVDAHTLQRREVTFTTWGPLRIEEIQPAGTDVDLDDVSLTVRFSTPLADRQTRGDGWTWPITIDPPVAGFPGSINAWGNQLSATLGTLPPHTKYTVTIKPGITDAFGQQVGGTHLHSFTTGDASPRLDVQTGSWVVEAARGSFPVWARNLTRLEVTAAAVPEAKLGALLGVLDWWDDAAVDLKTIQLPLVASKTLPIAAPENRWKQVAIDPRALLGDKVSPTGLYYFSLQAPEAKRHKPDDPVRAREVLVSFSNLGVTAKLAAAGGLVWVTSLGDGLPQANAEVTIRDRAGKVKWRGRTDAEGLATTPGQAALLPPPPPRAPDAAEAQVEDSGEDHFEGGDSARLLVFARVGDDVTFVDPDRTGGLASWQFNVDTDQGRRAERLRGFLHTDRGLYRPGDKVQLRGLVRLMRLGEGLRVPEASKKNRVALVVRDPRGDVVVRKTLALSRYGGFALEVPVGLDARLGDYVAQASLPEGTFSERFAVEEYRAATFETKARAAAPRYLAGEELRVEAEGRYLYGAPVRGGTLRWRVHSRPRVVSFDAHPDFDFGDSRQHERQGYAPDVEDLLTEKNATLDDKGKGKLRLRLPAEAFPEHRDLMLAAEVEDETHQIITANLVVPVYRSRLLLGIGRQPYVLPAGKPTAVPVVAVDPAGARQAASATLTVLRVKWSCAFESFGMSGSYRCSSKEEVVERRPLEIPADGASSAAITPPGPGEYRLVLEGKDATGRASASARELWVYGAGESPWRMDDTSRFEILADKPRYEVGETARLIIKAPTTGATALVTIEREGVLERRLATLPPEGQALEIPIREGYGPNVYVSLLLARGRSGKGARGLPSVRMGMVNLPVGTAGKRLQVTVNTDRPSYRPGEPVTARLEVKGMDGQPVQAEVALSAADEGVLSLIAFQTPDPLPTFHAPWGLGVKTATQYERLARLPEPDQERLGTGGDGPGKLGTLRSRFLATAYFNPKIETDAGGRAQVTFKAPDNLTAFRLMAVAADCGDRFGSGDRRFTVRKPLQLMAALPRFLSVGDHAAGGVVLLNETGQAGNAIIEAEVRGATFTSAARALVVVPVGGRAPVSFPVKVDRAGEVRFRFTVTMGNERDGLEVTVPARPPTRPEVMAVARGETTSRAVEPLALPAGVIPGSAALEVAIDGLVGIEESLRHLIEYPYGCLEQTTSRVIPLVAVRELVRSLGLVGLDGPKLETFIKVGLQKIAAFQNEDGGFGLWRGSRSEPYLTSFALWGLKLARDAGYPVEPRRLDEGVAYLRRGLGSDAPAAGAHDELGELGGRAFTLHVLRLLDRPEPGYVTKLLEQKDRLPRFGLAFLAQALAGDLGAGHERVRALLDELAGAAEPGGGTTSGGKGPSAAGVFAVIREKPDPRLGYYMSSDLRTSAIATDAFLYLRPQDPQLGRLIRGLLEPARDRDGHFRSTQENLYVLVALAHYAKTRPATATAARVTVGEQRLHEGPLGAGGAERIKQLRLPLPVPAAGAAVAALAPLTIEATAGTVHYAARLRFLRDRQHQPAVSEGFELGREYLDPTTGRPATKVVAGSMVRVRLTITTNQQRQRVAVSDYLPAALEPLNTRFVTNAAVLSGATPTDGGAGAPDDDSAWAIVHKEIRDDRVDVFYDQLGPGRHTFEYFARASTAGTFVAPAATVEQMYQPEVRARTALGSFTVVGEVMTRRRWLIVALVAPPAIAALGAIILLALVRLVDFPAERLAPAAVTSLTVRDASGEILRQQVSGSGGRQRLVPLDRISPALVAATLAAEDHRFFDHHGVDPRGVLRAAWLNLRARRFAFGGSTLTMQLVRLTDPRSSDTASTATRGGQSPVPSPRSGEGQGEVGAPPQSSEDPAESGGPSPCPSPRCAGRGDRGARSAVKSTRRGLMAKIGEAVMAARLERLLDKSQILEQYLNRAYYGNGAWGAEAAARFYLGKPAAQLSAGEAAFLAVLPRSPRRYDPFRRGLGPALQRRRHILARMAALGSITADQLALAQQTPLGSLRRERPDFAAPHLVEHALGQVPGASEVTTTVDRPLQQRIEVALREHLRTVGGRDISQAGLVVLRNSDGALLAMVGSGDYFDHRRSGAVNVTTLRRRPGSTLKPFVYALALEQGDTPATLALDVILPGEAHAPYAVDVRQHGLGRYREALAGSYNLAAVHTLDRVGVGALLSRLRQAGLTTLDWPADRYGLHLAIGEAEVTLLQLTAAFAAFGNAGRTVIPRAVLAARSAEGRDLTPRADRGQEIFAPAVAYQLFDMLADPDARRPMFGQDTPTHLPFPVAIKTGTTRAYTDNLALGTTREFTVGAWAGNFDGRPTEGVMAMVGAAPLVRAAFVALAARFGPPSAPDRPAGLVDAEICPLSGKAPGPACPHRKRDIFAAGHLPDRHQPCDLHQRRGQRTVVVYPEVVRPWARAVGLLREDDARFADRQTRDQASDPTRRPLRILFPIEGARFSLDPYRPPGQQIPPLRVSPPGEARWTIDGVPLASWTPTPGKHLVRAERGPESHQIRVEFD